MRRSTFIHWTVYFSFSFLLLSDTCYGWGYHHPAAIRLPTDKPTTTTSRQTPTISMQTARTSTEKAVETSTSPDLITSTTTEKSATFASLVSSVSPRVTDASSSYPTPSVSSITTTFPTAPTTNGPEPKTTKIITSTEVIIISTAEENIPTTSQNPITPEASKSPTLPPSGVNEATTSSSLATSTFTETSTISSSTSEPSTTTVKNEITTSTQPESISTDGGLASTEHAESTISPAPSETGTKKSANKTCIRNESEVSYWDFGYCSVNCTTDADCIEKDEKCICDGPCGLTCLTPDLVSVYCDAPRSVENGKALLVGDLGLYDYRNQLQRFMHNQKVIFECDEGYSLIDGPQEKICRNGLWFPAIGEPKCIFSDTPGFRWMQSNRIKRRAKGKSNNLEDTGGEREQKMHHIKRRAIKAGGSSSLAKKVGGGGSGGGGGEKRRGRKRGGAGDGEEDDFEQETSACGTLDHDEYIQFEVMTHGSDPNNTDISDGAVVRVSCTHGFGVNLQNNTIICDKGRWRPKVPQCSPLPCSVPYIAHGTFYVGGKALYYLETRYHTSNIELRCSRGYVLKGPSKFHCWYGEWDLSDAPECIPASCELPQLDRGSYSSRYRAGMVVGHGTEVDYHCDGEFQKMAPGGPAKCHLGDWRPNKPACFHPSYIHGMRNFTHDKENRLITSIKRSCGVPQREKGAIFYVEGKPIDFDTDYMFPDGTEVMYRCVTAKPKLKNRWKMVCEDGQWIGSMSNFTCEYNATIAATLTSVKDIIRMINSSCTYKKKETHVVTFFNDQQLSVDSTDFAPGSVLINRCSDIGKFRLRGAVRRKCISGQWLGITPKCDGLSQYYDYVVDKPPTILFRYLNGSIVQTNDGKLMVYPGTTIHMECLYIRKFGKPQWNVSNSHSKQYAEGWTDNIENRDPSLEYRLTIDNASEQDTGTFQCITPSRHGHEIDIIVKKVDCPPLPDRVDLGYSTNSTMLGTKVTFHCKDGNSLIGAEEILCQAAGTWSANLPKCENIECPDISMLPAMAPLAYTSATRNGSLKRNETAPPKISIMSKEVGGKASFSCAQGYMLEGATEAVCQSNGKWSAAIPLCKEVECPAPPSPQNGSVTGNSPYKAGDLAQFECRPGYMMEGQPIIACQDNGKWSRASSTTKCVKACTYPGTTIGGTISAVKFYYPIGETVEFDCTEGYDLQGSRMLHCLDSAKWSTSIPNCIPRDGGVGRK